MGIDSSPYAKKMMQRGGSGKYKKKPAGFFLYERFGL